MNRILLICLLVAALGSGAAELPERGLRIGCAPNAPSAIHQAVLRLKAAAATHPTLRALQGRGTLEAGALAPAGTDELARSNLILVGLPDDPRIQEARQYAAEFGTDRSVYIFGFGRFRGDLGYLESGSNPWLHSEHTAELPFETNVIILTGTSVKGVELAVSAFLRAQLVNGLVGTGERLETTLLDRAPAPPELTLPAALPRSWSDWLLLGVTDCGADVGRGLLQTAGREPDRVLLLKYYRPGAWEAPGHAGVVDNYLNGLDRCAYGNALLLAAYADPKTAAEVAGRLAADRRLAESRNPEVRKRDFGSIRPVTVWSSGPYVVLSTLPEEFNAELRGRTLR